MKKKCTDDKRTLDRKVLPRKCSDPSAPLFERFLQKLKRQTLHL